MAGSRRLFVGMFPPAEAARAVHAAARIALEGAGVRLVPAVEIHLTLHFLGATDEARIPDLARALERAVEGLSPARVAIQGSGAFPDASGARVLWVGLAERGPGPGRLDALARAAASAARSSGLAGDRDQPWSAHLTVARAVRGRFPLPEAFRRMTIDLPWTADQVLLLESRPGASGPERFPVLSSIRLRPEEA